jgi:hypothetical protein
MTGHKLLLAIFLAAVIALSLIYLVPNRNVPAEQASPHAIDQSG